MFHKASAVAFQLGSIIKHNAQSSARMHGHTLAGWRAQADTPNLIYCGSARLCLRQTCYSVFSYLRSAPGGAVCEWILDSQKGHNHRCHRRADHTRLVVLGWAFVHSISRSPLVPNYTHLRLTCSAAFIDQSRFSTISPSLEMSFFLHQCRVTAEFGRLISRLEKGSHRTTNRHQNGGEQFDIAAIFLLLERMHASGNTPSKLRNV